MNYTVSQRHKFRRQQSDIQPPQYRLPAQPKQASVISDVSGEAKQAVGGYERPALTLLPAPISENTEQVTTWVSEQATKLDETLKSFRVDAQVVNWTIGPAVVQFEVKLGRGVKVSKSPRRAVERAQDGH